MPSTTQKSNFHGVSFSEADKFLGNRDSVKIANNTWLERDRVSSIHTGERSISVRLHSTYVVTYWVDGSVTVNTGGYNTPTTARRISQFSPLSVSLKPVNGNHIHRLGSYRFDNPIEFGNRIQMKANGELTTIDAMALVSR